MRYTVRYVLHRQIHDAEWGKGWEEVLNIELASFESDARGFSEQFAKQHAQRALAQYPKNKDITSLSMDATADRYTVHILENLGYCTAEYIQEYIIISKEENT